MTGRGHSSGRVLLVGERRHRLIGVAHWVAFLWLLALLFVGVPLAFFADSVVFDVELVVCVVVAFVCNFVLGALD